MPHAGPRPRSAMSPCVKVVSQARLRCTERLPDATDPSFLALRTYQQKQASRDPSCFNARCWPTLHTGTASLNHQTHSPKHNLSHRPSAVMEPPKVHVSRGAWLGNLRAAQGGGVARQQAERVGVRRDDVVGADVHGVHDAAPLGGGAVLGPVGGGRPTSGALDGRRGA
eukprot:scaffold4360_cov73-Phaeocystis_antarctica.AAC.1